MSKESINPNDIPKFTRPKGLTVSKALQQVGKATTNKLMKLTGRSPAAVRHTIKMLYTDSKIHIGAYEVSKRGKVSRVWYWGDGIDARQPPLISHKEAFIPRMDEAAAWLRNPI